MPAQQPTRRQLLRAAAAGAISATAAGLLAACTTPDRECHTVTTPTTPARSDSTATLLVYFSRAGENYWNGDRRTLDVGNTEILANLIRDRIDCDVYRIEAAEAYSDRYDPTVARNVDEQNNDARPTIAQPLPDLSRYERVLLGSPIWNVQPPMIMATFAEAADLTGKDVHPFVTYAVSGLGNTASFYRELNTRARFHDGLAVRGEEVRDTSAGSDVDRWLRAAGSA
ncbi:flavodoxin [Curtobacterium sp. RIT-PI-V]|uniref:flavodoxin n=1 Tax=Curtobacterium sp. RIT-PI-V TaxID=3035296 RepID=UPI0021D9DE62|nr:flavodoxin [Curtobacterium sp. RIT-PI-V]